MTFTLRFPVTLRKRLALRVYRLAADDAWPARKLGKVLGVNWFQYNWRGGYLLIWWYKVQPKTETQKLLERKNYQLQLRTASLFDSTNDLKPDEAVGVLMRATALAVRRMAQGTGTSREQIVQSALTDFRHKLRTAI